MTLPSSSSWRNPTEDDRPGLGAWVGEMIRNKTNKRKQITRAAFSQQIVESRQRFNPTLSKKSNCLTDWKFASQYWRNLWIRASRRSNGKRIISLTHANLSGLFELMDTYFRLQSVRAGNGRYWIWVTLSDWDETRTTKIKTHNMISVDIEFLEIKWIWEERFSFNRCFMCRSCVEVFLY